jgi:hypothetical protein
MAVRPGERSCGSFAVNALDFSAGWGGKLGDLVECFDKAAVPRATPDLTVESERWRAASVRPDVALGKGTEGRAQSTPIRSADSAMLWLAEPRPPQGPFGKCLGEFILLDCGTN